MTLLAGFQLRRIFAFVAVAILGAAANAHAQQYPLSLPEGSAKPQRATSAKPKPVEAEPLYPANPLYTPYPLGVTYIPAILMSDGTVWANFGYGYVRVQQACGRPGRVIDGRGTSTQRREPRESHVPCYMRTSQGSLVVTR